MTQDELNVIAIFVLCGFLGILISHFLNKIEAINTKVDEILKTIREKGGEQE